MRVRSMIAILSALVALAACSAALVGDPIAVSPPTVGPHTAGAEDTTTTLVVTTLPPPSTTTLPPSTATSTSTTSTTTTTAPLEPLAPLPGLPDAFEASSSEPFEDEKTLAGQIAQAVLTWDPGATVAAVAAKVEDNPYRAPFTTEVLTPVFNGAEWSRARVVYPQLGGITTDRMSIMVVAERSFGGRGDEGSVETRTVDVRLALDDGTWHFDWIASVGGVAVDPPSDLSGVARSVVSSTRIDMPDSARWDIYRGEISQTILQIMLDLADEHPIRVLTLQSGHPYHVYGTRTVSRHTIGKAVDVYRVADRNVVDDRTDGSDTNLAVSGLCAREDVLSVGSPWDLEDEYAALEQELIDMGLDEEALTLELERLAAESPEILCRTFTDRVHQDHIHISVE